MVIRVVYFELAYGLSTDFFFNVFVRMAGRRGLLVDVYLDNGSNFVGVVEEFRVLVDALD